jgi:Common central domain of tyrosinase
MALGDGIRRNITTVSPAERDRLRDAFLQLDTTQFYPDGVSFWDKQEDIHKAAHAGGQNVHSGPAFIPWHREIVNRLESLIRQVDPDLSLHYWDWTTDPRVGGGINLFTTQFMGSDSGDAGVPFQNFESSELAEGASSHDHIWRDLTAGAPPVDPDATILMSGSMLPNPQQFHLFNLILQNSHNIAHGYIGGSIGDAHYSFHDPFVFLLHSNMDRLWAMWQREPGKSWRLDPTQVYGDDAASATSPLNENVEPWAGSDGLRPWAPPDNQQVVKTYNDLSIVTPPQYDTLPILDTTPPSVTLGVPDGAWHGVDVSILCTATDAESGLANSGDAAFTLSTNLPLGTQTTNAATGTRTICDIAGNCVVAGPILGNKVDKKPPLITINQPVSGDYPHNTSFSIDITVDDGNGSGLHHATPTMDGNLMLASHGLESGQAIDLLFEMTPGPHTFNVYAVDNVGNVDSSSVTFHIIATPESIVDSVNTFRANRAIKSQRLQNSLLGKLFEAATARQNGDCTEAARKYQLCIDELEAFGTDDTEIKPGARAILIADFKYLITHCP